MTHHTGSDEGRLSETEREALIHAGVSEFVYESSIVQHGVGVLDRSRFEHIVIPAVERILAARAAAPDALRGRVEALAAEIADPRFQRPGMQRRRIWADRIRALADPTDGATT